MEALKNLITNVPDWLKRLDELNGQIEQRQIELARLTEETKASSPDGRGSPGSCARSVRNKGSTESLKPRDEPEAHPRDPQPPSDADNEAEKAAAAAAGAAAARASAAQPASPSSPSDAQSPTLQVQVGQVQATGRARPRATLRKRQRTDSLVSAEGAAPKYRTRSMIIVYYDSYVQAFFEDLVKFVSASRNMMRKAKMAAKVARIKRLAELEMPDEEEEEKEKKPTPPITTTTTTPALTADDAPIAAADPKDTPQEGEPLALPFVSTRRMGPGRAGMYMRAGSRRNPAAGMLGPDGKPVPGDVYDELDKGLDYVQSMCEHAAHQFLRDGDCGEEVANIKRRLGEVNELADKEMERVRREEPEALLKMEDENGAGLRGRSYRPQSMRRDVVKPASPASPAAAAMPLEVDEGVQDVDGQETAPKLAYKSTRMMA